MSDAESTIARLMLEINRLHGELKKMEDPNKESKQAFLNLLASGEVDQSLYMPSKLKMQQIILALERENAELKRKLACIETKNS